MSCRKTAEDFINDLIKSGKCIRASITGSLRRGEPYTHDVDIVCADPTIPPHISMQDKESKLQISRLTINSCDIDMYQANPIHYGAMQLMTTSPAGSQIGMRNEARKKELRLNHYGIWDNDNLLSADWSEDEICQEILGRPCKLPELRGRP